MRRLPVVCLAVFAVVALQRPAEAGRRARRAVRTAAVAGAVVAVASAPRRPVVAAAAYPVAVGRAPAAYPVAVAATPDLTIVDMSAVGDDLCITVQNIGHAASPQTTLKLTVRGSADGAVLAEQVCRVLPLAAQQLVRMRVRSAPLSATTIAALVDPDQLVVEMSEQNNSLAITVAAPPEELAPPILEDEVVWNQE